jgi:hypothetical protein
LKSIGGDVEHCLSMCVEERLRRFISTLIRVSKQRIDTEKSGHQLVITSDVGRQILRMNQKAKEEWDKKQAEETDKNKKQNEVFHNIYVICLCTILHDMLVPLNYHVITMAHHLQLFITTFMLS